jgi:hypothetical protein
MGEAGAVIIPFVIDEDLGFIFEKPKRGTVNNAITIALKGGSIIFEHFRVSPTQTFTATSRVGGKIRSLHRENVLLQSKSDGITRSYSLPGEANQAGIGG